MFVVFIIGEDKFVLRLLFIFDKWRYLDDV